MHEEPSYEGMYARPYLSTGITPDEIAMFNRINDEARPQTKGIREKQTVTYYDIEIRNMDYANIRPIRDVHISDETINELTEMLSTLRKDYKITFGNHDNI